MKVVAIHEQTHQSVYALQTQHHLQKANVILLTVAIQLISVHQSHKLTRV